MEDKYDIFISYADADRLVAKEICDKLESKRLECFIAQRDIVLSDDWALKIRSALNNSEYLLLIVTHSFVETPPSLVNRSHWVFLEIGAAWVNGKRIIPAIRDSNILPNDLPSPLDRYQSHYIRNSAEMDALVEQLSQRSSIKEEKCIRLLLENINNDILLRESELLKGELVNNREWFIKEISRCNVGNKYYIKRYSHIKGKNEILADQVLHWLKNETEPYLFLVGPSGIGKTNFLIAEIISSIVKENIRLIRTSKSPQQSIVFFPLGSYDPECSFWSNFERLVNDQLYPHTERVSQETFEKLVKSGAITIILDGLDEFARVEGEDMLGILIGALQENVDSRKSKIIISCRNHIFNRLKGKSLFKDHRSKKIIIGNLEDQEVKDSLKKRLGEKNRVYQLLTDHRKAFYRFARKPLLLEMMCEISDKAWNRLSNNCEAADLYDTWFEDIIQRNASVEKYLQSESTDEIRKKVEEIAIHMLHNRSDFVAESKLQEEKLLPNVIDSNKQKLLGIFIKQTETQWSFVHDSFREFSLAKKLVVEFISEDYDFLKRTSSFDYVGAETYEFVYHLLNANGDYVNPIKKAIDSDKSIKYTNNEWNNIVRNCFEAIGEIADDELEKIERSTRKKNFIQIALDFLWYQGDTDSTALTCKTKYDVVRSLERLHKSGPNRPYFRHCLKWEWKGYPPVQCFGAFAVRGFHLKKPEVKTLPPMVFKSPNIDKVNPYQKEVSECLLSIIQTYMDISENNHSSQDCQYLIINATFALIRWLHKDHIDNLKQILCSLQMDGRAKGNLFLALFKLEGKDIFKDFVHLFDGMVLRDTSEEITKIAIEAGYNEIDIKKK